MRAEDPAFWAALTQLVLLAFAIEILGAAVTLVALLWKEIRRHASMEATPADTRLSIARARLDAAARTGGHDTPRADVPAVRDLRGEVPWVGPRGPIH